MDVHNLEISDEKLFEHYSKEQWMGCDVNKGSYLFDQKKSFLIMGLKFWKHLLIIQ